LVLITNIFNVVSRKSKRIKWGFAERLAKSVIEKLEVLTPSLSTPIKYLSGGNQQKVMVGNVW